MAVFVHHRHRHNEKISRPALFAAFGLCLFVLGGVALLRLNGVEPVSQPPTGVAEEQVESVVLSMVKGGGVDALDPVDGTRLATIEPGRDGFVRGILHALDRQRMQHGVPAEGPVEVVRWADGRTTLRDPSTQWSVELRSFGSINLAVFLRLMSDISDKGRIAND